MIKAEDYEKMWDLADKLAEKEKEEQNQTNRFKLERRDIHMRRMTEKVVSEKTELPKEQLRRHL
jgi:hypothetical protein